jgi:5-methylcytosine-specific restriction protein A
LRAKFHSAGCLRNSSECRLGESGEQFGYKDGFDSADVFLYTGEGQVGDMTLTKGNRAICDHSVDGRALHLFKSLGKGKGQRYLGEFVLASYSLRRGPDRGGNDREIIVLHLLRVDSLQDAPLTASLAAKPTSLAEARKNAVAACSGNAGAAGTNAVRTVYERSRAVRDYVLLRANGNCEACAKPAPFLGTDSQPYLEAHHTTRLSDGGIDHPRHVAALCPTCHREVHYGKLGNALNQRVVEWLLDNEPAA